MSFVDPTPLKSVRDFTPTVEDQLIQDLGTADEDYRTAVTAAARAANAEDRAYHAALASSDKGAANARDQEARAESLGERQERRIAEAVEKACLQHLRAVLARVSYEQTRARTLNQAAG